MELKHTNLNDEIVLARDINLVNFSFEKLWKLLLEMNLTSYFFMNLSSKQKVFVSSTRKLFVQKLMM